MSLAQDLRKLAEAPGIGWALLRTKHGTVPIDYDEIRSRPDDKILLAYITARCTQPGATP